MKKLPLGIQTLAEIINHNYLYVDKTAQILPLITEGKYYFLSRPRRFGKSLLVSTLKELFLGNQELFSGLYIHAKWKWKNHPVVHIDFSSLTHDTPQHLQQSLGDFLMQTAAACRIKLTASLLYDRFRELLEKLAKIAKVVILVDEYDKPIIDHITDTDTALANRDILRSFFAVLKPADPYLRFVFLTGVSKFSKVSIFSGLNNLTDISLHPQYTTLLGITQAELEQYFFKHITALAVKEALKREQLLAEIKYWYNGYSWDGKNRLYNPASLLNLFYNQGFKNYWFATGTPTFLVKTIRDKQLDLAELENKLVSGVIMDSFEIGNLALYPLLFQAGYLTIIETVKKGRIVHYRLNFPNFEVRESLLNHLLAEYTGFEPAGIQPVYMELLEHLAAGNIPAFRSLLINLFSRIPYNLHIGQERYYHSLCYLILALLGAEINLEVPTDKGRMDGVLELDRVIYVIEFKMDSAAAALAQIKARRYWEPYTQKDKELILLGIGGFREKDIEVLMEKV